MGVDRRQFETGLRERWREIRDEAVAVPEQDFVPWPDYAAYHGGWLVFPLLLRSWPEGLVADFAANRARCPVTVAALEQLGACGGVLSRMEPGCHILRHRDAPDPGVLRAHLGLSCPGGAWMQVGDEFVEWSDGEVFVFDGQREHETRNTGRRSRLVLLADFVALPERRHGCAAE